MSGRSKQTKASRPATTPEGRENQLIAKAMALVERQIDDGTASSQLLSHFVKQGSLRDRLERERLEKENALLTAKVEAMASAKKVEELYGQALEAMRSYAGQEPVNNYDD